MTRTPTLEDILNSKRSVKAAKLFGRDQRLLSRIILAWRVLFASPTFVVVYDNESYSDIDDGRDQHYGYFDSPEEAKAMFDTAYGSDPNIHSAKLAVIVEDLN